MKLPDYYAVCYELPCSVTRALGCTADQSRPYANAGLVQCFRRSSVVGCGNVLYCDINSPKVSPTPYR